MHDELLQALSVKHAGYLASQRMAQIVVEQGAALDERVGDSSARITTLVDNVMAQVVTG